MKTPSDDLCAGGQVDTNTSTTGALAALEKINEWCCYASEEDTAARLLALQQVGLHARSAIAALKQPTVAGTRFAGLGGAGVDIDACHRHQQAAPDDPTAAMNRALQFAGI